MDFNNQLYLTKIILDREKIPDFSKYPLYYSRSQKLYRINTR